MKKGTIIDKKTALGVVCLLAATLMGVASVSAAAHRAEPRTQLTDAGNKLLAKCADMLKALQAEIGEAVPNIDEARKSAFVKAYQAEIAAAAAADKALKAAAGKNVKDKEAAGKALTAAQEALAKWSWWDKDEAPRSGTEFLLETQARTVPQDYLKVLRSQWISDALGEQDYNDRKGVAGGFWSAAAHYQALAIAAATKALELGPVGQDVAEASESKEKDKVEQAKLSQADLKIVVGQDGVITIPAVLCSKSARTIAMNSFASGMQLHCVRELNSEQKFECMFDAPQAGKYAFSARVSGMQVNHNEWLTVKGGTIGPEMAFGHIMGQLLNEPVLVLKSCIGNRGLGWDLLPPGSERFVADGKIYAGYKDSPNSWDMDKDKGEFVEPGNFLR